MNGHTIYQIRALVCAALAFEKKVSLEDIAKIMRLRSKEQARRLVAKGESFYKKMIG